MYGFLAHQPQPTLTHDNITVVRFSAASLSGAPDDYTCERQLQATFPQKIDLTHPKTKNSTGIVGLDRPIVYDFTSSNYIVSPATLSLQLPQDYSPYDLNITFSARGSYPSGSPVYVYNPIIDVYLYHPLLNISHQWPSQTVCLVSNSTQPPYYNQCQHNTTVWSTITVPWSVFEQDPTGWYLLFFPSTDYMYNYVVQTIDIFADFTWAM